MNAEELEEYVRVQEKLCKLLEKETVMLVKFNQTSELLKCLVKYHQSESNKILDSKWRFMFQGRKLNYHMRESDRLIKIWEYLSFLLGE